jgi:hypothetical protein
MKNLFALMLVALLGLGACGMDFHGPDGQPTEAINLMDSPEGVNEP